MRAGQDTDCNPANAASIIGTWKGRSGIPKRFRRGLAYNRSFPFTDYTLRDAIEVNLGLAEELTRAARGQRLRRRLAYTARARSSRPPSSSGRCRSVEGPSLSATATPAGGGRVDFSVIASDLDGVRDVWWSFGDLEGARGPSVSTPTGSRAPTGSPSGPPTGAAAPRCGSSRSRPPRRQIVRRVSSSR